MTPSGTHTLTITWIKEAIQNKAARWARRDYRHTTSVTLLKQHIKLDPLATRRQIYRQQMIYKIINNLVDINKDTYLQLTYTSHQRHPQPWIPHLPDQHKYIKKFIQIRLTIVLRQIMTNQRTSINLFFFSGHHVGSVRALGDDINLQWYIEDSNPHRSWTLHVVPSLYPFGCRVRWLHIATKLTYLP